MENYKPDMKLAQKAVEQLKDERSILLREDRYMNGRPDEPFCPDLATKEFRTLVDRAMTNMIPMLISAPAQALYVDSFRRKGQGMMDAADASEMEHFQRSRLDARQSAIYRAGIGHGVAYARTYISRNDGKTYTKGLSPLQTITYYNDPATDLDPVAALYVGVWTKDNEPVKGVWYDATHQTEVTFKDGVARAGASTRHGASQCPITRFAPWLDLLGRPTGLVQSLMGPQDRFNQTILDLLVAQSYASFNVRTVTGMAPPMKMRYDEESGELVPVLDREGNPVPDEQRLSAARMLYAEDADTKFGTLPATSLDGFLASAEATLKHMSTISQVPPHFLLGQIANVSAEALQAAQTNLLRMVDEIQHAFGESWERVFRVALEMEGNAEGAMDYSGEVVWKDVGGQNIGQIGDALGKFAESLDIPKRGLWPRVPNVTQQELSEWSALRDEDNLELQLMERAFGAPTPQVAPVAPSGPAPPLVSNPLPTGRERPFS